MECLRHVAPVVCLCLVVGGCGRSEAEQAQLQAQATRGSSIPEQMGHRPPSRVYSATVRGGGNRRTLSAFTGVLPGRETEQARDVAVDAVGNIIIVGGIQSPDFPVSHDLTLADGAGAVGSAGPMSVFVVRLNQDGSVAWSTVVGGPNYDRAYAVELDDAGDIYVAGRAGRGFPTTPGVVQESFAGDSSPNGAYGPQDWFIFKLSADGSRLRWSTYFGDGNLSFKGNTGHLTLLVISYASAEAACMAQESRRWRAHWRSCPRGPESLTT